VNVSRGRCDFEVPASVAWNREGVVSWVVLALIVDLEIRQVRRRGPAAQNAVVGLLDLEKARVQLGRYGGSDELVQLQSDRTNIILQAWDFWPFIVRCLSDWACMEKRPPVRASSHLVLDSVTG
jgi:hypothetical protein